MKFTKKGEQEFINFTMENELRIKDGLKPLSFKTWTLKK